MVDPDRIRMLVEMMSEHDLSEICLRSGEEEILLKRPGAQPVPAPVAHAAPAAPPPPSSQAQPPPTPAVVEAAPDEESQWAPIKSPMVGTFYASPDPQSPAFVTVGSHVSANTVVCIIEAMKVFNEIKAEVSGTVEKVLVKNEDPVEYGQPLFLIRPD